MIFQNIIINGDVSKYEWIFEKKFRHGANLTNIFGKLTKTRQNPPPEAFGYVIEKHRDLPGERTLGSSRYADV